VRDMEINGGRGPGVVDTVVEAASEAAQSVRSYLATDRGRRLRRGVAALLIVGAPLASELPVLRRTPLARALRAAGVVALVVKGAEWLRDWEPAALPELPSQV